MAYDIVNLSASNFPDLTITTGSVKSASGKKPNSAEDTIVTFTVKNIGKAASEATVVQIYNSVDSSEYELVDIKDLAVNETVTITYNAGKLQAGYSWVVIEADYSYDSINGIVVESDEDNNDWECEFTVVPDVSAKLPDLKITTGSVKSASGKKPNSAEDTIVTFTVKNIGKAASEATKAWIYKFVNGSEGDEFVDIQALAVNETVTITYNAGKLQAGYSWVDIEVDSSYDSIDGIVVESDEDNNDWECEFTVVPGIEISRKEILLSDDSDNIITLRSDKGFIDFETTGTGIELVNYNTGLSCQNGSQYTTIAAPDKRPDSPQKIETATDGMQEIIFATKYEIWASNYVALHTGNTEGWSGTGEKVYLKGKNKIADTFYCSEDGNLLLLTDNSNGDALFVDDIYTASPGNIQEARLSNIQEIRAGSGNDVVDMTSSRFEYTGDGLTIRGGDGDDVIWSNKGENKLFGDAGNDSLTGASGNDIIVGGAGNDRLHGGGGSDIFAFGGNWGYDTIDQLDDGEVTLWFEDGITIDDFDINQTEEGTILTSDRGTILVNNMTLTEENLRFGSSGFGDEYAELSALGAFSDISSEKVFENNDKKAALAVL